VFQCLNLVDPAECLQRLTKYLVEGVKLFFDQMCPRLADFDLCHSLHFLDRLTGYISIVSSLGVVYFLYFHLLSQDLDWVAVDCDHEVAAS